MNTHKKRRKKSNDLDSIEQKNLWLRSKTPTNQCAVLRVDVPLGRDLCVANPPPQCKRENLQAPLHRATGRPLHPLPAFKYLATTYPPVGSRRSIPYLIPNDGRRRVLPRSVRLRHHPHHVAFGGRNQWSRGHRVSFQLPFFQHSV